MAVKKVLKRELKDYTDRSTGEVMQIETAKFVNVKMGQEEKFYMTFCEHVASIYQLTYADDIKLLVKMCELSEYESGEVYITPKRRVEMLTELNMQTSNMSKSLRRLKEKNLISGENGEFLISPLVFWKGARSKRLELLKNKGLSVTFNFMIQDGE